jgi:hypothetical protein
MKGPKSVSRKKPVVTPKSKNEPTDHGPTVLHEQAGKRPNNGHAWRSFAVIDDEWVRRERKRRHLKDS